MNKTRVNKNNVEECKSSNESFLYLSVQVIVVRKFCRTERSLLRYNSKESFSLLLYRTPKMTAYNTIFYLIAALCSVVDC